MKIKLNSKSLIVGQLFFCLCLGVCSSYSQQSLSLKEVEEMVVSKNLDIQISDNEYSMARNDQKASYMRLLPNLNINGEAFKATGRIFDDVSGTVRTETGEFLEIFAGFNWDVLNILKNVSSIKSTRNAALMQKNRLESMKDEMVLNAVGRYLEILQNQKQDTIFLEFYNVQERNLNRTEEMIKVGALPGQDYYTQKTELSRLKSVKVENLNTINNKKNELLLLLNLEAGTAISLEDVNVDEKLISEIETFDMDYLSGIASKKRYDIKSQEFEVETRKYELSEARSAYYPSISVFYNYGSNFSSFQPSNFQDQFYDENVAQSYGIRMTIPIFNGLKARNEVYKSKKTFESAKLSLEQFKNEAYTQISNTLSTLKANNERRGYRQDQFNAAKKAFEMEEERYYLGAGDPRDLANAQRDYIEAALLLNQVNYQILYNIYELKYFSGQIREKNINLGLD